MRVSFEQGLLLGLPVWINRLPQHDRTCRVIGQTTILQSRHHFQIQEMFAVEHVLVRLTQAKDSFFIRSLFLCVISNIACVLIWDAWCSAQMATFGQRAQPVELATICLTCVLIGTAAVDWPAQGPRICTNFVRLVLLLTFSVTSCNYFVHLDLVIDHL